MARQDYPQRKANRLVTWDYSNPGAYFITICTLERKCILSSITVGGGVLDAPCLALTERGKLVEDCLLEIIRYSPSFTLDNYVIMPNHLHLLVSLANDEVLKTSSSTKANAAIPHFVSTLKRFTNKASGEELWQRSYHDHVIRNDRDYQEIWQYIDNNPARWVEDCYAPKELFTST